MRKTTMIESILSTLGKAERFVVASHRSPDGDAIGSTLALVGFLRALGKQAVPFNLDGVPEELSFLPGADSLVSRLADTDTFDVGFVLDSGELSRAGSFLKDHCSCLINIDHHPHSESFGRYNLVDEQACATAALIYRLIRAAGRDVSADVALCLYTAILSDTGSFRYSNANPEAFQIASELVRIGVSPWMVAGHLYENRPACQIQLLNRVLDTLLLSPCGRFGAVSVTSDMLTATGTGPEHTDGFVNYPRSIRGVEVALFFRQIGPERFKVGFRSKGKVDVGTLARNMGGGGHHNAAGATIAGELIQVQQTVFARLNELLPPGA
jgi:phosphoesterase RecJ-like protein